MRYAIIENGVVANIVVGSEEWAATKEGAVPIDGPCAIGWAYADGEFTEPAPPPIASDDVDAERDRRIAGGFTFGGVFYQSRPDDRENIAGASTAALGAMMAGAQPGDLRWHGGASDFTWIAADNSETPMDAQTMFAFGQAAMGHKQRMILAARALKDADPIPADFATNEAYWS